MTTRSQKGGSARKMLGLAILAITAYVVARLLLYLFPAELRMVGNWLKALF